MQSKTDRLNKYAKRLNRRVEMLRDLSDILLDGLCLKTRFIAHPSHALNITKQNKDRFATVAAPQQYDKY